MNASFERKLRSQRTLSLILAVALVFVGIAYTVLWFDTKDLVAANAEAHTGGDAAEQTPAPHEQPDLSSAPYMVLGDDAAPVTIYEWTDFTCPYCGLYHRDTLPQLVKEYVDSGRVRLEVHDVTFIGEQAEDAAVAARAAGKQDRYFDYLFAVYDLSADGAQPDLSPEQLRELAKNLGLDVDQFSSDFADTSLREAVQTSTAQAQGFGINSVPFFLVTESGTLEGAQQLQGAQELDVFRRVIDAKLQDLGR